MNQRGQTLVSLMSASALAGVLAVVMANSTSMVTRKGLEMEEKRLLANQVEMIQQMVRNDYKARFLKTQSTDPVSWKLLPNAQCAGVEIVQRKSDSPELRTVRYFADGSRLLREVRVGTEVVTQVLSTPGMETVLCFQISTMAIERQLVMNIRVESLAPGPLAAGLGPVHQERRVVIDDGHYRRYELSK